MENQPTYYSVLPAAIRYDNSLIDGEKIYYSEITALSNKNGVCTAPNSYFAKLYNKCPETISRWTSRLVKRGYITIDYLYREGTKEIEKRLIKIVNSNIGSNGETNYEEVLTKISIPIDKKINGGIDKNVKDNNTSSNNIRKYNKRNLEPKKIFGSLENVFLSLAELDKLQKKFINNYEDKIEDLSLYLSSTGKKYNNHYATILAWDRRDNKAKEETRKKESKIEYNEL